MCVGRVLESEQCVVGHGRVVESVGCVCWEGGGECSMCVGRVVVM